MGVRTSSTPYLWAGFKSNSAQKANLGGETGEAPQLASYVFNTFLAAPFKPSWLITALGCPHWVLGACHQLLSKPPKKANLGGKLKDAKTANFNFQALGSPNCARLEIKWSVSIVAFDPELLSS